MRVVPLTKDDIDRLNVILAKKSMCHDRFVRIVEELSNSSIVASCVLEAIRTVLFYNKDSGAGACAEELSKLLKIIHPLVYGANDYTPKECEDL